MMPLWGVLLTVLVVVILTAFISVYLSRERARKKLEYMLDAFEDGEYNFRFAEKSRFNKSLNRVKWIVERRRQQNEQESWTKLIRVLTHEIMNTVSPIASLSDALKNHIEHPQRSSELDIKAGLETISSSSKSLITFVESYRELAGVARPRKRALQIDELVGKVIELTREQCSRCGATCSYKALSEHILVYADESQISRILINLIKNALQAGARSVVVEAYINQDEQSIIKVANDGAPISPEAQEQIFIPFFSTKRDGSGIGLSLSREIMRAHNGTIELTRSDKSWTEFTLTFR